MPARTSRHRADPLPLRGRLQRALRRQRRHAARDAALGAAICAVLVLALPRVDDQTAADATTLATANADQGVFSAAMVGDVMFGRHVEAVAEREGYRALLEPAAPHLDADYVSANLEQVVSERADLPEAGKLIHLKSDARPLDALADVGFTTLTLANNHTMDHGLPGLGDTIEAVEAAGMDHVGAGMDIEQASSVLYQDLGELTVATLSFTDAFVEGFIARAFQGGVLDADPGRVIPLVEQAAANSDLVIAQFHWGREYDFSPTGTQRDLAVAAAEAGADIVVGHHPHVLMPVERIDDTVVFYSLGNFVFDQGWSRTRETAVARYTLAEDGTATIALEPMFIREATPTPLDGLDSVYRRTRIHQQLAGEGLDWRREGSRLVTEVDHRHVLERAEVAR